jgi:DNA polymerase IV
MRVATRNQMSETAQRDQAESMSCFLHIDMDAFYASVEQALDPSLAGKAVIVGGGNGRGVVTSASYEARKFGVYSAMPGFRAKQLCPHGVFLPNRHRVYSEYSRKVFAILRQYSPEVHAISIDEALVDLTGTEKLFGPALETAAAIIRRIAGEVGLPSSGGVSSNAVVSKIAATLAKPRGLLSVAAGDEKEFLAPLAVDSIPGVGPKTHKNLLQRGIRTIGDLLKDRELANRFLDFAATGERHRHHNHSVGNETTFDQPLQTIEKLERILWELVEQVAARLRKENVYARAITVKIRYGDFHTITRSRVLTTPTFFDREIFAVGSELLRRNYTGEKAVRLLGVSAATLQDSPWQEDLLGHERHEALNKLYRGIDRLREKYGDETIGTATSRQRRR